MTIGYAVAVGITGPVSGYAHGWFARQYGLYSLYQNDPTRGGTRCVMGVKKGDLVVRGRIELPT